MEGAVFIGKVVWPLQDREARALLIGLGCSQVLAVAGALIILTDVGAAQEGAKGNVDWGSAAWMAFGVLLGSLLAGLQRHPRRRLGLIPYSALVLAASLAWAAGSTHPRAAGAIFGLSAALTVALFGAALQAAAPADARGYAMAVLNGVCLALAGAFGIGIWGWRAGFLSPSGRLGVLAGLATAGSVVGWWWLLREALEQLLEWLMWPVYRIRATGPGLETFPRRGPVLVIGNHTSWFDPGWLGKVLPRRLIPMMTSDFYDLPVVRPLMAHVFHVIRVQASTYRREAPELEKAVAALDRGECVVLFPEGFMRRRVDRPLRQFGQGIWHILRQRPQTPVVACWIEGGWGTYFSYFGGPPLKNKRMRFWRRIDVAVGEPEVVEPGILKSLRATRRHLMQRCLEGRKYLGLEVPTLEPPAADEPEMD